MKKEIKVLIGILLIALLMWILAQIQMGTPIGIILFIGIIYLATR